MPHYIQWILFDPVTGEDFTGVRFDSKAEAMERAKSHFPGKDLEPMQYPRYCKILKERNRK